MVGQSIISHVGEALVATVMAWPAYHSGPRAVYPASFELEPIVLDSCSYYVELRPFSALWGLRLHEDAVGKLQCCILAGSRVKLVCALQPPLTLY